LKRKTSNQSSTSTKLGLHKNAMLVTLPGLLVNLKTMALMESHGGDSRNARNAKKYGTGMWWLP